MNVNVSSVDAADAAPVSFEVERLGARLGAQIHGLDLKQERPAGRVAIEL